MSDMTPAQFLSAITDGGPVNICSIVPDGELDGYIIRVDQQLARIEGWVEAKGATAGLYYSLNEPLPDLVGKRDRLKIGEADVAAIRGIVLDLDPKADEVAKPGGLERERARIRAIVEQASSSEGLVPATFCVDSGGGFQIGWMFPEPIPATPEAKEAVKAQARGLGIALGGDATFSIDHLFRLPGTMNHPNAKKRSLGRTDAPALVVSMDTTRRYKLDDLAKVAPPVAPNAKVDASLPEIDYGTVLDVAQLGDAALSENLRTYREMLRQWNRFDTVMDGPDRSKRDIALASECIRLGLVDPTDIACVVFSVAPEKLLEEEDNNRGERYARRMLADRLAKVKGPGAMFGETDATAEHNESPTPETPKSIVFRPVSFFATRPVPARDWIVPNLVPSKTVTLLTGDGGTGKSLLALQLAASVALGRDWLGNEVKQGPVLIISAEDDDDELHRRFEAVFRSLDVDMATVNNLRFISLAGEDAVLGALQGERILPTPLFKLIEQEVADTKPVLVGYDTLADLFGGNEINRTQTRQFIGLLRGISVRHDNGGLLLGHPSVAGMQSGAGTSGSTAWSNSVRSRLYLERIQEGGHEPNPDLRRLTTKKSNYGPVGAQIGLKYVRGVFQVDDTAVTSATGAGAAKVQAAFLQALEQFNLQGRAVSSKAGANYAPKLFAEAGGAGYTKQAYQTAMNALFAAKALKLVTEGRAGKERARLVACTPEERGFPPDESPFE